MRILLVEPFNCGHHAGFMKAFVEALRTLRHEVVFAFPDPEVILSALEVDGDGPSTCALKFDTPSAIDAPAFWRSLQHTLAEATATAGPIDEIFINNLDGYFLDPDPQTLREAARIQTPWSGLYFFPRHLYRGVRTHTQPPDRALFRLPYCRRLAVLDERIQRRLSRWSGRPVFHVPELVGPMPEDANLVAEIRERAAGRPIVGVLGSLSKRKGLAECIEIARRRSDEWFFLFAGPMNPESFAEHEFRGMLQAIHEIWGHSAWMTQYLSDAAFNACARACDVHFCAYHQWPYSSNMVARARALGKPAIVAPGGVLASRVKRGGLGVVARSMEASGLENAIARALGWLEQDRWQVPVAPDTFAQLTSTFEQVYGSAADPIHHSGLSHARLEPCAAGG
ncbi:MAG: hypothetical protein ACFB20_04420 [Opitutales bacterium]